jgi:uncharacterized protein
LRINVGFLINQPVGTSRNIELDHPTLYLPPDLEMTNFNGSLRIGRAQQGIYIQGDFDADVTTECVRCLAEFKQSLHTNFTELYAFSSHTASEMGLVLSDDGNVDLAPIIREYISIEIPISPLCKPDCKGLCPICGEDLNLGECEHQQQRLINLDQA